MDHISSNNIVLSSQTEKETAEKEAEQQLNLPAKAYKYDRYLNSKLMKRFKFIVPEDYRVERLSSSSTETTEIRMSGTDERQSAQLDYKIDE